MKTSPLLLCAIFATLFSCRNNVEQYELSYVDSSDATTSILNAIQKCKKDDITRLVLPKGKYIFYPEKALQKYCVVSNNDNGIKHIAFPVHEMKNFEIDGQGSELIFHGHMMPFNIDESENITLKNFSIDWEQTFNGEGTVIAVNEAKRTFDIQIPEQKKYRIEKGILLFEGEGWTQDIGPNLFFDTIEKGTVYRVSDYKLDPWNPRNHIRFHVEEVKKGIVRITDTIAKLPKIGWRWIITGKREHSRVSPAIRIYLSKNIKLENVNIHHAGAMGIIGERSENIFLLKTNAILPEGKNRLVTTTADATHFVNCKGTILIDSCFFENMLDDATNIHGIYGRLISHVDENTIGVKAMHFQQNVTHFAQTGDSIRFINNKTLETIAVLKLKNFRFINDRYAELTFDSSVKDIPLNSGLDNLVWYPHFIMRNSEVRNNRARSILISTTKKVIVENNIFRHPMMSAISISGDVNYWFESGNVTDVTIRNNHFIECCTGGKSYGVIRVEPVILQKENQKECFHKNIIIENNIFESFDRPILNVLSVEGLIFRNNTIKQTTTYAPIFADKPAFYFSASKNILIENNEYIGLDSVNVVWDTLSQKINVGKNKNFNK